MDKKEWEQQVRKMWRDCFGDTLAYEDFYFENVYPTNAVWMHILEEEKLCGMLHLNPYNCMIQEKEYLLHYIVGVATQKEMRRNGIMRNLLCDAIFGMYENKEPFTYLMPANVVYYETLDFVSIAKEEREKIVRADLASCETRSDYIYVSYLELRREWKENIDDVLRWINQQLEIYYTGYAVHDLSYMERLSKEKESEGGNVIFCFEKEMDIAHLRGYFAYGIEEKVAYIEQSVWTKDWHAEWISCFERYLCTRKEVRECVDSFENVKGYPYMMRVLHVPTFIQCFSRCFEVLANKKVRIYIEDSLLIQNTGVYEISNGTNGIQVSKIEETTTYDIKMSVTDLVSFVMEQQHFYFAEIV